MRPFEFCQEPGSNNIECRVFPVEVTQLTEDEALRTWKSSEFNQCRLDVELLSETIATALKTLEENPPLPSLELEESEPEPVYQATVGYRIDATCEVEITDDKMQAEVVITVAEGGRHLETTDVKDKLVEARVSHGLEFQLLNKVVMEAQRAEPGTEASGIVAEGTPPASGIPTDFEFLVIPFEDRILQPQSRDDGTLDMHNLGDIEVVDVGQELVRRIPSKPGESGSDVMGNTLFSEALQDKSFDMGEGTEVSSSDPHLLVATRHGVPLKLRYGMKVDEVLVVRDVDLNTGNVEYDGSVMIKGDVKNGMCVSATGDVYVNGFVENARIDAQGSVVIKQGIIGKPELMKDPKGVEADDACVVKGQNIMARYAQNAFIEAKDKVELGAQLLHSHVLGCRELHVGDEGKRKAKLVGGTAVIGEAAFIGTLGSIASTTTVLQFDRNALPIQAEISEMQEQLDGKLEVINGLVEAILVLRKQKPTPELIEKARKAKNTVDQYKSETDQFLQQIEQKQNLIDVEQAKVRLHVYGQAFPNVELKFLDTEYKLKEERKACEIGIKSDRWVTL